MTSTSIAVSRRATRLPATHTKDIPSVRPDLVMEVLFTAPQLEEAKPREERLPKTRPVSCCPQCYSIRCLINGLGGLKNQTDCFRLPTNRKFPGRLCELTKDRLRLELRFDRQSQSPSSCPWGRRCRGHVQKKSYRWTCFHRRRSSGCPGYESEPRSPHQGQSAAVFPWAQKERQSAPQARWSQSSWQDAAMARFARSSQSRQARRVVGRRMRVRR
jgi:hypothetical protein